MKEKKWKELRNFYKSAEKRPGILIFKGFSKQNFSWQTCRIFLDKYISFTRSDFKLRNILKTDLDVGFFIYK